jgi:hypothetical protein
MILTDEHKFQEKREAGELTGFVDCNLVPIRVGDFMTIGHLCNCEYCDRRYRVQILWNDEWKAYGMRTDDGEWLSGMGIASGYFVESNK